MQDGLPVRKKNCQLCEACYNICPKQAIILNNHSESQYWHPEISLKQIAEQKPAVESVKLI